MSNVYFQTHALYFMCITEQNKNVKVSSSSHLVKNVFDGLKNGVDELSSGWNSVRKAKKRNFTAFCL